MFIERIGALSILTSIALTSTTSLAATLPRPMPAKDCVLASSEGPDSIGTPDQVRTSFKPIFPPVQLDLNAPVEPTLFPSGGFNYLIYELNFQNYTDKPLAIQGLEIVDASRTPNITSRERT